MTTDRNYQKSSQTCDDFLALSYLTSFFLVLVTVDTLKMAPKTNKF